jgi:hypothetical protein
MGRRITLNLGLHVGGPALTVSRPVRQRRGYGAASPRRLASKLTAFPTWRATSRARARLRLTILATTADNAAVIAPTSKSCLSQPGMVVEILENPRRPFYLRNEHARGTLAREW